MTPGLKITTRTLTFAHPTNPADDERGRRLLDRFAQEWMDSFPFSATVRGSASAHECAGHATVEGPQVVIPLTKTDRDGLEVYEGEYRSEGAAEHAAHYFFEHAGLGGLDLWQYDLDPTTVGTYRLQIYPR